MHVALSLSGILWISGWISDRDGSATKRHSILSLPLLMDHNDAFLRPNLIPFNVGYEILETEILRFGTTSEQSVCFDVTQYYCALLRLQHKCINCCVPHLLFTDDEEVGVILDDVPVLPGVGQQQLHLLRRHLARLTALKRKEKYSELIIILIFPHVISEQH